MVADEVRNLAQRSSQAARDTAALIEESIAKSDDGKTKVDQVAAVMHSIIEQSSQVKTLVDEVNLGSQEQTLGIEQVAKAISQMEQVTQTTAANAEESAAAAEQEHVCRSFGKCVGALQSRRAGQAASTVHFLDFGLRRVSRFRLCNHDIWAVVGIQGDGSFGWQHRCDSSDRCENVSAKCWPS